MTLHVPPRSSSIALSAVSPASWPLRQILPANPIDGDDDVPCPFPPLNYHESGIEARARTPRRWLHKNARRMRREDFFTPRQRRYHASPSSAQPAKAANGRVHLCGGGGELGARKGGILNLAVLLQSRSSEKDVCTVRRQKQGERGATYARALFLSVTSVSCSRNQSLMLPRQGKRVVGFHLPCLIPVRP